MYYSLSFLLLLMSLHLSAQQSLKGKVIDDKEQPLVGATLSLTDLALNSVLVNAFTDTAGNFSLKAIKPGKYRLKASFIAYLTAEQSVFVDDKPLEAIIFQLKPETQMLASISMSAKKPQTISMSPGKAVLNVAHSSLAQSQSAFDLLKTLPGVTVNKDGEIRIKGKSGVTVMIDGEPVEMTSSQLKNVLKGTPGSTLQAIEVLNNAPVSMDAAGTGGVINLVFNKKVKQGFSGVLNSSISKGTYYNHGESADLRFGSEKWNTSLLYAYDYEKSNDRDSTFRSQPMPEDSGVKDAYMSQFQKNPNRSKSHLLKLSADYIFNEKNSLGLNFSFNEVKNPTDGWTNTRFGTAVKEDSLLLQANVLRNALRNLDYGMKYKYLFREGVSLMASAQINNIQGDDKEDFTITKSVNLAQPLFQRRYRNLYPSKVDKKMFKVDYQQALKNEDVQIGKFEAGVKSTLMNIHATQIGEQRKDEQWQQDPLRSNSFAYREVVHAAYSALEMQKKSWTFKAGLRGEYTRVNGAVVGQNNTVQQYYFSLFPNALLGYKVNDQYELSLRFDRRIERPDYEKLNPSVRYIDAYTTLEGNPILKPQFSNNLTLNQQFFQFVDLSLGFSQIKDPINSTYIILDGARSTHQMHNTDKQQQWEVSLSFPIPGVSWWENYQSFYAYSGQFNAQLGEKQYKERATSFGAMSYNAFKLPKSISIELTAWYETGGIYSNWRYKPMSELSLGLSKKLMKERLTMTLALTDVFYGNKFSADILSNTKESTFILAKWDSRQVKFSLNYNFGKSKKDKPSSAIEEEEGFMPEGTVKQRQKKGRP